MKTPTTDTRTEEEKREDAEFNSEILVPVAFFLLVILACLFLMYMIGKTGF